MIEINDSAFLIVCSLFPGTAFSLFSEGHLELDALSLSLFIEYCSFAECLQNPVPVWQQEEDLLSHSPKNKCQLSGDLEFLPNDWG